MTDVRNTKHNVLQDRRIRETGNGKDGGRPRASVVPIICFVLAWVIMKPVTLTRKALSPQQEKGDLIKSRSECFLRAVTDKHLK